MSNQISIKNLSPEQIEDIRQQLKAFDEQPKSIMDKVKSWEDAKNIIKPEFWIKSFGVIAHDVQSEITKNNIPSEKHALSLLATSQLMVIAEALNEGWNPDFNSLKDTKFFVVMQKNKLIVYQTQIVKQYLICFKSMELAEYAMNQFEDLWYDYFMVNKPK